MNPAELLEGVTLEGTWFVEKKIAPRPGATGGHFSTGYLVTRKSDGLKGFLKAMDYSAAFNSPNTIDMLRIMSEAYTFERDICEQCRSNRINRVVHAIHHGTYMPDPSHSLAKFLKVEFLIFEKADCDIRAYLDTVESFDLAFIFRILHNCAAALEQMHRATIAHQDLKPSNVLVFLKDNVSKIGDLGRAWWRNRPTATDNFDIAGDTSYAPPELLWKSPLDEAARRFGCDMYLLGSLVVFLFTRVHMNALLVKHAGPLFQPATTPATYQEAIPHLQAAFAKSLSEFQSNIPKEISVELTQIVQQLCQPDISLRGHPINRGGNQFSLSRFISKFDLLAYKAELFLKNGTPVNASSP